MMPQKSWALQAHVCTHTRCTPPLTGSCVHARAHTHCMPPHTATHIPKTHASAHKSGPRASAFSRSRAGYLSPPGRCAEPRSARAGCADARSLHPLGPPALAAGRPRPGRATEEPSQLRGTPVPDEHLRAEPRATESQDMPGDCERRCQVSSQRCPLCPGTLCFRATLNPPWLRPSTCSFSCFLLPDQALFLPCLLQPKCHRGGTAALGPDRCSLPGHGPPSPASPAAARVHVFHCEECEQRSFPPPPGNRVKSNPSCRQGRSQEIPHQTLPPRLPSLCLCRTSGTYAPLPKCHYKHWDALSGHTEPSRRVQCRCTCPHARGRLLWVGPEPLLRRADSISHSQ